MPSFKDEPRWLGRFAAMLILVFLVQALLESRYKSVATDEPPHIASGLSYLQTRIFRANLQHPPLIKELAAISMSLAGVRWPRNPLTNHMLYDALAPGEQPEWMIGNQIIAANGADRVMTWARAPMLLVAGLMAAVLFLWGRRLVGAWAAAGAVFLCTMDPTILGHSYLVTTDMGVAAFTLLFLFALWNYVHDASRWNLALSGLAMGAMLCTKYSAVLMLPAAALLLVASRRPQKAPAPAKQAVRRVGPNEPCPCGSGRKYKRCHGAEGVVPAAPAAPTGPGGLAAAAVPFLVMCAIALAVIEVVYLFSNGPSLFWTGLMKVNADHRPGYLSYMAGELRPRFYSYFAVAWLLKEPLGSVILTCVGLWALLRRGGFPRITKLFILVPAAVMFLGTTFLADDWGIRYIMPALPLGHLLGGLGIVTLARKGRVWVAAAALLCAWVLIAAVGVYPDRLPYFNESACLLTHPGEIGLDGGTRCGPLWLDDSNVDWGQSLKQLKTWLDQHAPGRPIVFAGFISFPPDQYGIRYRVAEDIDLKADPRPGIYAISATRVARVPVMANTSDWLRRIKPAAIVGHSIYVYEIPERGAVQ